MSNLELTLPKSACIVIRFAVSDVDPTRAEMERRCGLFHYKTLKRAVELSHVCSRWRETQERWNVPLWQYVALVNARFHLVPYAYASYYSNSILHAPFSITWVRDILMKNLQFLIAKGEELNRARLDMWRTKMMRSWKSLSQLGQLHRKYYEDYVNNNIRNNQKNLMNDVLVAVLDFGDEPTANWMWTLLLNYWRIPIERCCELCRNALEKEKVCASAWLFAYHNLVAPGPEHSVDFTRNGVNKRLSGIDVLLGALRCDPDEWEMSALLQEIGYMLPLGQSVLLPHSGERVDGKLALVRALEYGANCEELCWGMDDGEEILLNGRVFVRDVNDDDLVLKEKVEE